MNRRVFTATIAFESETEPMPTAAEVERLMRTSSSLLECLAWTNCNVYVTLDQTDPLKPDEEPDNHGQPCQCSECEEPSVGFDEGTPFCALHYRSRRYVNNSLSFSRPKDDSGIDLGGEG